MAPGGGGILQGCWTNVGGGSAADGGGCCVVDCTTESDCCCGAAIGPTDGTDCVAAAPFCIVVKTEFGGGVSIMGADVDPFCKYATAAEVSPTNWKIYKLN